MTAGFRLSPGAEADIDEIWLYIANDSVTAANRVRDRILADLRRLAEWPLIGHTREDIASAKFRFSRVGRYQIVYRPGTNPLEIVRVLGGERDLVRLLASDE